MKVDDLLHYRMGSEPMTYEHIGGGWECVDSRTGYRQLPIDPLCYPWWCECEYETPMNRWEIKFCDEGQSELWAEWYIPDWLAYHADREGCDIQPIHGQPFATDAVRTLAVIEDYRRRMLRMAGVPSEYLTPDREGKAECTD